jgi:hypothetical protein
MTQTTVTLTGGAKVNLNLNPDRVSHLKARDALEAIQEAKDVSQATAVELAVCYVARATVPTEALEIITAERGCSDAKAVRKALVRYGAEVEA